MNVEPITTPQIEKLQKRNKITIIVAIILLLCLLATVLFLNFTPAPVVADTPTEPDGTVFDGTIGNMDPDEVKAMLQKKVDESQFAFEINSRPCFQNGTLEKGNLRIQNPPQNRYNMVAVIKDDKTGKVLYESPTIKPLQYIEYAPLEKELSAGQHPATATFKAYTDKGKYLGEVAAAITIYVN